MEQLFQLTIQTPTKAISLQTTNPDDVINMMKLSGQSVVSHEVVAISAPTEIGSSDEESCSTCGMTTCECGQTMEEEYENTPDATRERGPRSHGEITDFGAPGQGHSKHGYRGTAASGDNPLTFENITTDYSSFKKKISLIEGLEPEQRSRLDSLISDYEDATDPSDYNSYYDPLSWKKPVDRITKAGKMYKQDSDYLKNTIKARYRNSGKSATEGVAEAGNRPVDRHFPLGTGDTRTARELKTQMQGASDEFVNQTAKEVGPMHSRVAKMQGKLAKSELRRREQGVAEGEVTKKDIEASKKKIDAKRKELEKQGVKKSQLGEPSYYLDAELRKAKKQGVAEGYPKHQDLSGISTDKLKAYLAKQSQQQVSGEVNQVKRVRAELQRREQGMGPNEFTGTLDSKGRFTKDTVKKMFGKLSPDAKGVAEGAPELLKAEMPLVRHIEQELAKGGWTKDDPEYKKAFSSSLAYYRKFGNAGQFKEKGVAEGSLNEGQYEMMMRNGQVKKFIAKDDADAKRIAAGHGAKSVIKLRGGVPAGKIAEQGVAGEFVYDDMAKSAHAQGYKDGYEGAEHNMASAKAQHGENFKHYNAGFFKGRNEMRKKLSLSKPKQGVAEGVDPSTDSAQDARGSHRGDVKKNKDGSYVATNQAGSRKIFKSEQAAKAHANSGQQGVAEGSNSSPFDQMANLKSKSNKELDELVRFWQRSLEKNPNHKVANDQLHIIKMIRAERIGKKGVAEGIGDTIKRGVKSVKRGIQGWGQLNDIPDDDPRLLPGAKDTPRQIVARNKGYDDKTVTQLARPVKSSFPFGGDDTTSPHSPRGLQKRVLDREMKKRGLDEQGVAEGGAKDRQWSNKDMEKLRVATRDFDDIMASDGPEATKQNLIKKRIQTKPMAGPKGVLPEQGVAEGQNDYFKRRKDEEDRIAGTKPPAKRTPQQTDYAKRRAQEKKNNQGVTEANLDPSGLIAAASMVRDFIITAETDGQTKKFRIRGMTGPGAAKERFLKHHSMAKVLDVKPEQAVDEGWKSALAATALAATAALGGGAAHAGGVSLNPNQGFQPQDQITLNQRVQQQHASQDLSGFGKEYLEKAANPDRTGRFLVSVDDAKAELAARLNGKQQSGSPASTQQQPGGFSKEYLEKAANPNRTGRFLISVEKAQELLNNVKESSSAHGKQTKYAIKHKETGEVLSSHDDEQSARDEHKGLGADKAQYKLVKTTKTPKTFSLDENSVMEGYTGRETKEGTWRVFKDGEAVAKAGPFKSAEEASAWIKKQKQGVTEAAQGHTIEAYGVRGMSSKPWTKTFKDSDALNDWCEKYDAECYGQRELDDVKPNFSKKTKMTK